MMDSMATATDSSCEEGKEGNVSVSSRLIEEWKREGNILLGFR